MNPEIIILARCDRYHPKHGAYDISEFTPSADDLFARIQYLQEHGDPEGELALRLRQMNAMARAICRDTAILFALTGDRSDMPDDVRDLLDLCLPPAQTPDEAFPIWLGIARRGAQMELDAVTKANLQPDVKSVLADLIQRRLHVAEQQTDDRAEQAMQVVAVWWMHEELMKVAGVALDAVGLATAEQHAKEKAQELSPLDTDYAIALTEVEHLPLTKFGEQFERVLGKQKRLNANPSGTGKNPEYEHERAEANYIHSEDDRSPLEREIEPQHPELQWLVPKQHDPLKHALEREEVETILNAATGKTRQLLELILQGYKVKEAAEAMGITPNSAYVLLHKLRKKFSKTS